MKKEQVILSLPCKMKLNDFTTDSRGIHCGSCDKVLTDFRGKSDKEVIEIVRNSSQKLCGVFDPVQVDYKRSTVVIPTGIQRFGLSLLGILGFLGPVLSSCSDNEALPSAEKQSHDKIRQAFNNLKFPMRIEGVLRDEASGEVMAFASVTILQSGKVIRSDKTDKDGNFSILLERGDLIREDFEFAVKKGNFADTVDRSALKGIPGQRLALTVQASCSPVRSINGFVAPEITMEGEAIAPGMMEIPPPPPPLDGPLSGDIMIEQLDPVPVGKPAVHRESPKKD